MAAEVPVSVVLCEAMEYLSKLGANLRTRSENLKDKRINKDKLKNAHAVHKAASKGKSDSNQNEIVDVESDDAKTEMAENSSDVTKSTQNTAECTSTNSDRRKPLRIMSISDTEDDIVPLATKSSNSVSTEDSVSKLVSDENKSEDSSATTENNNVDHTESLVKEHRESHSGPEDGKVSTEESSKKKSTKGGPITIFFNRKNTVKKSKTNGQQKNSSQILPVDDTNSEEDFKSNKNKEAQKENKPASNEANCSSDNLEPIKRKRKNSNVSDSSSQINDDSTKNSEENNMQKELNDDSNDSNNSKPLIRCVNITKLLKPDAVPVKSDLFAGKQSDIREHFSKKGSAQCKSSIKRVKHSLLNDSDSDKEIGTNIDSQVVSQKEINPATIKDSLLCDSDSDKNEEQVVKENSKVSDGNTNNSQERIDTVVENIIASLSRLNEHSAQNQEKSDDSSLKSYVNKENDNHNVSETEKLNEPCHDTIKAKSSLLNDSDSDSEPFPRTKERFISARESSELKKMLLNHSSSSEHEESVTNVLKRGRKKSRSSNSSSSETAKSKKTACSEKAHNSSINQIDGTVDEHSDSSVKKMVRSKSKPSGSSVQNSEIQDASDRDIEGLTNLNSLNKSRRHGSSSNNTESRSSARQACKLKQTPTIGEDLLHAESSSDVSENNVDENVEEEDLPKIHGLNGDSIGHLAKDDLLNESDSSASQDVEATEDTQHIEDSEEENVISKRRKANAISSDSEGGTSRRKHEDDEEARVSDFEDSEDESSESAKRSKRKKKPSESDGSAGSSNEGKKKRRRIKQVNDSDGSGSDTENEGRNKHGRKNIRKVMGKNQLEEATKKAAREEKERIARIADRQKLYNNLDFDETGKPDEVVLEKVVLDFDPETKEPLIQVDRGLVKKLKPHQVC
ncbi:dentin sialophosphoprotein-like [Trichoplusia ni]|uniref:Dentin sialophosphoprotein-like n=1 Tax=Trichoplusia ni TaxID=7111 RepID=A0A7E5WZ12_TRINI|nr:dentin sialophosphoprotein-like [Trichoplusia ni]